MSRGTTVLALLAVGIAICCACAKVETAAKRHTAPRSPIPHLAMVASSDFGSEREDKFARLYGLNVRGAIKKRSSATFLK
jgi:hypothetical protein